MHLLVCLVRPCVCVLCVHKVWLCLCDTLHCLYVSVFMHILGTCILYICILKCAKECDRVFISLSGRALIQAGHKQPQLSHIIQRIAHTRPHRNHQQEELEHQNTKVQQPKEWPVLVDCLVAVIRYFTT